MFVYRDKFKILHAVDDEKTAKNNAVGPVVEMSGYCENGYPFAIGPSICDYGNGETYVNGNRTDGKEYKRCDGATQGYILKFLKMVKEAGL